MDVEVVVGGCDNIVQYRVPLSVAVLKFVKGFSPRGRASRSEFWWALLFSVVLYRGVSAIAAGSFLFASFALLLTALSVTLGWRRMHDIGKPGWWCLVPLYDLLLAMLPSELNENQFGLVPNTQPIAEAPRAKKVVFGIMIVSVLIAVVRGGAGGKSSSENCGERLYQEDGGSEAAERAFLDLMVRAAADQQQYERQIRQQSRERYEDEVRERNRKQQIMDDEILREKARDMHRRRMKKTIHSDFIY